jgi:uncharacterized protein (DUF983 family)
VAGCSSCPEASKLTKQLLPLLPLAPRCAVCCTDVGKTAIAEGLAYAIVHEVALEGSPLHAFLRTKRVLQLPTLLLLLTVLLLLLLLLTLLLLCRCWQDGYCGGPCVCNRA